MAEAAEKMPESEGKDGTHAPEIDFGALDAFGESLAKTRSEAINSRQQSGIEDIWLEDEEFYEGIDERNRGTEKTTWKQKIPGQASVTAVDSSKGAKPAKQSSVFPNITGPFVDSASARISDMLLPTDDRAWALRPTPIPESLRIAKGKFPLHMIQEAAEQFPVPEDAAAWLKQQQQEMRKVQDQAKMQADAAQLRIEDWHVECQYHAQVRTVIEDSARIGTGVLKGPFPMRKKHIRWDKDNQQIVTEYETKPVSKWIDPWNFYPDGACGENIHNGSYTWERDYHTRKQLRELIGQKGYIKEQIIAALEEGAHYAGAEYRDTPTDIEDEAAKTRRYEVWYYHGTAEQEDLEAAGMDVSDMTDPHIPVLITMVNNRVIRVSMNPLDTGEYPYDVMVWRRRAGHWTGIGVARQIRTSQKIVTGATRNLMENAGLAAGPMIVFRQGVVYPADGVAGFAPRKIFYIAKDADEYADATKAIGQVKVDMLVNELLAIVEFGMQLAESTTNMPMILQGQMGGSTPDTLGGQQMFMNNASTVLRRLARIFDDRITEPHIRRTYHYLLQHGPKEEEKGDFSIDARGSSALVEREIQNQELLQMGQMVLDPRFGKDPKKWMDEYLKSRRFDVKRFDYEDEEWEQIVENMAKGPQDPRLQIAQMKMESDKQARDHQAQLTQWEKMIEVQENEKARSLEVALKEIDGAIKQMDMAKDKDISLDNAKRSLSETVIKIRAQLKLAGMKVTADQMPKPPTEPPGRAPKGESYQK